MPKMMPKPKKSKKKMMKPVPITDKCLVCFDTFKETTDEIAVQLICGHVFHYDCILESYKMKTDKLRVSARIVENQVDIYHY